MSQKKDVVVLGAGVTGLAAAYRLSRDDRYQVHVIEKAPHVGGLCRSFKDGDFILDYGPHKFYTLLDGVLDELENVMGEDLMIRDKAQSLYMFGKYFSYPLKMSEMLIHFPISQSVRILFSYGLQICKNIVTRQRSVSYQDFITERFGKGLYGTIFEPMAKKVYGDPKHLDKKLAEVRISSPSMISVIKQLLFRSKIDKSIQAAKFHYPKQGYGMIPDRLREKAEANGAIFHTNAELTKIKTANNRVTAVQFNDEKGQHQELGCDGMVYTIPIAHIARLMDGVSPKVQEACDSIKTRNTIIYYFLLKSKPVLPSMWVFFPESAFRFGRLSEMTKFSPHTAPEGHTALMVDFTCENEDPEWKESDEELGERLLKELESLDLFDRSQIVRMFSKRFPSVYPVYNVGFQERLKVIRDLEGKHPNLFFIGRQGDFNYNNADQCLDMGFRAADAIREGVSDKKSWQELREQHFDRYKIVD